MYNYIITRPLKYSRNTKEGNPFVNMYKEDFENIQLKQRLFNLSKVFFICFARFEFSGVISHISRGLRSGVSLHRVFVFSEGREGSGNA